MGLIITGHVVGIVLAFISSLFNRISNNGENVFFTAAAIVLLFGLLEFMIFSSLRSGRIYFRGFIYENDQPGKFKMQQFLYALLAGFLVVISIMQFT